LFDELFYFVYLLSSPNVSEKQVKQPQSQQQIDTLISVHKAIIYEVFYVKHP